MTAPHCPASSHESADDETPAEAFDRYLAAHADEPGVTGRAPEEEPGERANLVLGVVTVVVLVLLGTYLGWSSLRP